MHFWNLPIKEQIIKSWIEIWLMNKDVLRIFDCEMREKLTTDFPMRIFWEETRCWSWMCYSKIPLKVHSPIFQNLVPWFIWKIITPQILIQTFSWNSHAVLMYEAILYIAVAYILLCKLNYSYSITRHIFIYTFQTEHFWTVKFAMGY